MTSRSCLFGAAPAPGFRDIGFTKLVSLYPALNRMLVKGWLTAKWGISENNRKARFYQLTTEGRAILRQEEKQFQSLVNAIFQVMRTA